MNLETSGFEAARAALWTERPVRVALAEDDDELRVALADTFVAEGFEVSFLSDGDALLDHLEAARARRREPDVLVLDHHMPGTTGLDVVRRLRVSGSKLPVLIVTGFASEVRPQASVYDACSVFDKPLDLDRLLVALRGCAGRASAAAPAASSTESVEPTCAACGSTEFVRFHDALSGVCFCVDCWRRSQSPSPYDDIGGSG